MITPEFNIVTGAFGYTGKYITQRLLSMGERVKTLTGRSNHEKPYGNQLTTSPFNFDLIITCIIAGKSSPPRGKKHFNKSKRGKARDIRSFQ
jgi:short subunit dehydrogenase-like uncharacterized protein